MLIKRQVDVYSLAHVRNLIHHKETADCVVCLFCLTVFLTKTSCNTRWRFEKSVTETAPPLCVLTLRAPETTSSSLLLSEGKKILNVDRIRIHDFTVTVTYIV